MVFDDKQLTYRELNQRANKIAHHLKTLGVGPEVLVGICVERSIEMGVSLLGILKAGGAYLPLDPALPQESLTFRLQDAHPGSFRHVFVDGVRQSRQPSGVVGQPDGLRRFQHASGTE